MNSNTRDALLNFLYALDLEKSLSFHTSQCIEDLIEKLLKDETII